MSAAAAKQQQQANPGGMATPQSMKEAAAQPPRGRVQQFALQMRSGETLRFGSRLEAEAENVRRGYTGTVKPA